RTLGGTLDVDRVAARLTELAQAVLGADAAGTWLIERGSDELILKSGSGFTQSEPIARIPHASGRDVLGWITDRSGPVVLRTLPGAAAPARPCAAGSRRRRCSPSSASRWWVRPCPSACSGCFVGADDPSPGPTSVGPGRSAARAP